MPQPVSSYPLVPSVSKPCWWQGAGGLHEALISERRKPRKHIWGCREVTWGLGRGDENLSFWILCLEQMLEQWLSTKNTCLLPRELSCHPASGGKKEPFVSPPLKESLLLSVC